MVNAPDKQFVALANKYIQIQMDEREFSDGVMTEKESSGNILKNLYKNLQNPEMIIPVIGLQGVGKSTLINGILKENVMPNEADETTCIPVEVRYGDKPLVRLFFSDGRENEINAGEIREYVDNNYNPGNKKKVSHIVIYRNIDILKTGIVLVDLPGVGSMTTANQETTMRYIKKLYSAIYVIRVTPPITRTEAFFIKATWYSINNAWFVQNRWNNESDREVEEGLEFNKTTLKDIADKNKINYNKEIITVNAYKALTGVLQNKSADVAASNITGITGKLKMISVDWREQAEKQYIERTLNFIGLIKDNIKEKIKNCGLSKAELKEKLKKEEDEFKDTTYKIREQIMQIKELLIRQKADSLPFIQSLVKKAIENIRVNIYHIADSGVTDGDDLTQAFKDYQTQEFEIATNDFMDFVRKNVNDLTDKMEELCKVIEHERSVNFAAESFYRKQQIKWEKGLNVALKLGGAIGGYLTFAAIGAAFGSAFPVVGTIVGAVAGILVGIVASLIGGKSQQLITAERAAEAKRQIAPVIDDLQVKMTRQLTDSFTGVCDNASAEIKKLYDDRCAEEAKIKDDNIKTLQAEYNTDDLLRELEDDLKYITEQERQIHA